jgi:TRAP-type C4-dicarboxylate transport system substrate-binding protein
MTVGILRVSVIKSAVVSLLAAAAMAAGTMVAQSQETQLRFATAQPPDSIIMQRSYGVWADALNEEGEGLFEVTAYPPPFATTSNMWDRVTAGVADIGVVSLNNTGLPLTASFVPSLPGLGRDAEAGSVAMWRLYERGLLEPELDEVVILGFQTAMSLVLYSSEPITTMEQLAGLRVRVVDRNTASAFTALGASPSSIPFSEAYQAVSRGVVDAALGNGNTMVVFRFRELLSQEVSNVAFGMPTFAFVMNKATYEGLSDEARAVIDSWRGERLSRFLGAEQDALRDDFDAELIAAGELTQNELSEEELARWSEAMAPVTQAWVDETPNGQEVLDAYLEEYNKVANGE